ncbi:toll/interleukin-1 receptor domain-containing protein [Sphaerochaeta globosa]|uniref:TIR domain-containing protein n=1 Tax=Sphaerochaeta globosa (strain ATCC BAA-1886 / DSM 22777 / Buddy) TaxID=158189 RepID=F0RRE1_SPHGB|nr:toll/interleukin-1 receptor domain-containing protein [Sphaerochaeta globosa]ADY14193.1 hypothetical protein SpiBuddy_2378 [Sphaerochaeta globosa str. Buddy]
MNEQNIKFELPKKIDTCLKILSKQFQKQGRKDLQEIVVNSIPRIQTGWSFDNWNGGTYGHALYLAVPEIIYPNNADDKTELQDQITKAINKVHDIQNELIAEVFIETQEGSEVIDWRKESGLLLPNKRVISAPVTERIWGDKGFRVFLSHKTEVKKETAQLKAKLKLFGISCFVAHEDIDPTQEWQTEIENALNTMDSFIALLTGSFHDSNWTDQEVGFAFGRGVPIISVRLERDPYGFIGKFQALSSTWIGAPDKIVQILIKNDAMVNAYIEAIKDCTNYDESNKLSELLPYIEKLSQNQIDNIIDAFNSNSQINESYGFNGRKPTKYGEGLVYHLNRVSKIDFKLTQWNQIERLNDVK